MKLEGWLLGVRLRDDEALLWVKTGDERVELRLRYYPDFFALPEKVSFNAFLDLFDEHPNIPLIETSQRYTSIGDTERSSVLRVCVESVEQYRSVLRLAEQY
ncbi:MAG: hypothetical protein V1710_08980, partial [Candidatus Bathyarchaeota archaeon]